MEELNSRLVLNHDAIVKRIHRMAWQVYEELYPEKEVIIAGIKDKGYRIAGMLCKEVEKISEMNISLVGISLDKQQPFSSNIELDKQVNIEGVSVILVDDVLNTGRTLIAACMPLVKESPKRLKTAILANRDHKEFPIAADFVGISLATTLEEHLSFNEDSEGIMSVHLD